MVSWFSIVIVLVIGQRLVELVIANRNGRYVKRIGGYEVGRDHYPYIVALHVFFFAALWAEVQLTGKHAGEPPYLLPFACFLVAQGLRVWCLLSLGRFWNTRIYVVPGSQVVERGPYRLMRHPNYVVVALELLTLPLSFGAVWTAVVFTVLNAVVLRVRIRVEEQALIEATAYAEQMGSRPRFLPVATERE